MPVKEESKESFSVKQKIVQYEEVIENNETLETLTTQDCLVYIMNKLDEIDKTING